MRPTPWLPIGTLAILLLLSSCTAPPIEPGFSLSLPAPVVTTLTDEVISVDVDLIRIGGFAKPVTLRLENAPSGVSAAESTIASSASTGSLQVAVSGAAAAGSFNFAVEGSSGGVRAVATLTLKVVLPTGTVDASFGDGGVAALSATEGIRDLVIDGDGNLLAIGQSTAGGAVEASDFALARYGPDGTPDSGFGTAGVVTTDFFGSIDVPEALTLAGGKIVVAGSAKDPAREGEPFVIAVARYTSNGNLDTTFGEGGMATLGLEARYSFGYDLVVDADGGVLVTGRGRALEGDSDAIVVASFDEHGTVLGAVFVDVGADVDEAFSIRFDDASRLVLAGRTRTAEETFEVMLARLDLTGELDPSFGEGGIVTTLLDGGDFVTVLLEEQREGEVGNRLLVGGYVLRGGVAKAALARFLPDGSPDAGFGVDGLVLLDPGGESRIDALAYDHDGNLLAAGSAAPSETTTIMLAMLDGDGVPVADFNKDGIFTYPATTGSEARAMVNDAGGAVVLAGSIGAEGGMVRIVP